MASTVKGEAKTRVRSDERSRFGLAAFVIIVPAISLVVVLVWNRANLGEPFKNIIGAIGLSALAAALLAAVAGALVQRATRNPDESSGLAVKRRYGFGSPRLDMRGSGPTPRTAFSRSMFSLMANSSSPA